MKISQLEKITFTKHLSVMLKAGIVITEALDTLASQTKSSNYRKILGGLKNDTSNGTTFEKALSRYPAAFDQFYQGMIKVGETTGKLDTTLVYLSEQLTREYNLKRKVQGALMYPVLVLSATFLLGGAISIFILPKLVDFFNAFEAKLPITTVILLKISLFMKDWGILLFLSIFVFFVIFQLAIKTKTFKPHWDRTILRFPLFGNLIKESELSRLTRTLGILIKSGVPITQALEITKQSLSNSTYQTGLGYILNHIQEGKFLAPTMQKIKGDIFSRLLIDMVSVGEKTGKLDESLMYVSQFYEDDIDEVTKNLTNILEPALLIFIGLIVGFMALSIIGPIYQLTGSIG